MGISLDRVKFKEEQAQRDSINRMHEALDRYRLTYDNRAILHLALIATAQDKVIEENGFDEFDEVVNDTTVDEECRRLPFKDKVVLTIDEIKDGLTRHLGETFPEVLEWSLKLMTEHPDQPWTQDEINELILEEELSDYEISLYEGFLLEQAKDREFIRKGEFDWDRVFEIDEVCGSGKKNLNQGDLPTKIQLFLGANDIDRTGALLKDGLIFDNETLFHLEEDMSVFKGKGSALYKIWQTRQGSEWESHVLSKVGFALALWGEHIAWAMNRYLETGNRCYTIGNKAPGSFIKKADKFFGFDGATNFLRKKKPACIEEVIQRRIIPENPREMKQKEMPLCTLYYSSISEKNLIKSNGYTRLLDDLKLYEKKYPENGHYEDEFKRFSEGVSYVFYV